MKEYQPFPISNFRTGFDEALEPWLLPRDAYQVVVNAHLYRGVLEKIEGYTLFATFTNRNIKILGTPNGTTKTFTGTLPSLPVTSKFYAYGTLVVGSSAETFSYASDASSTVINLMGSYGGTGTVNIATGAYSITFNTAPPSGTYSNVFLVWDSAVPSPGPYAIMGIEQYYENNGAQQVLVFDERRVGIITSIYGVLAANAGALQAVVEVPHDYYQSAIFTGDGTTVTFTGTLSGAPFIPGTLVWLEYLSTGANVTYLIGTVRYNVTIIDNGFGGFIGSGIAITSGSINYVTGVYTITFTTAPASGNYFDSTSGIYGDLFTGGISNFFSLTNYQYKAFFTNNQDPIFYYDGKSVHYLNTSLETQVIMSTAGVPTNYNITSCLHVFTNRERLLLINCTVDGIMAVSTIFWSLAGNPLVFTNDELLQAPTSEPIRAIGFINSDLVVRFANSERVFRYTNDAFSPFRFDSTNNVWACDAPYSTINYDKWFSSVGRPAIVGSDALNVKRVDEIIPDFTDPYQINEQTPVPFMNQSSIQQCYGERFDDIKEGWLCYNSFPIDEGVVTASDNILAFNYLDDTYAVYSFPFSCLGFGRIINVQTWGTTFVKWGLDLDTWGSYQITNNALIDLGGDQYDRVFVLNDSNVQTNVAGETIPVLMSVISKNFNPFVEDGQLCRLGYIDLLVTANNVSTLNVQFYVNDQLYIDANGNPAGYYQDTQLTFTTTDAMSPTTNQSKVWKRIYVGSVAKFHTIRFYQNYTINDVLDQPIYIHAMVLYMKPAGRIFN